MAEMEMYNDAVHLKLGNLKTVGLTVMITFMFKHNIPAIVSLTKTLD